MNALCNQIRTGSHSENVTNALCGLATCLSQFQHGVGEKPLEALGVDLKTFGDNRDLHAIAKAISDGSHTQERFNRFAPLVELDEQRIDAAIAVARMDANKPARPDQ